MNAHGVSHRKFNAVPADVTASGDDEAEVIVHASPVWADHGEAALVAPIELAYDEAAYHRHRIYQTYVNPANTLTAIFVPGTFLAIVSNWDNMGPNGRFLLPLCALLWCLFATVAAFGWSGAAENYLVRKRLQNSVPPRTVLLASALDHQQSPSRSPLSGRVKIPYACIDKIDVSTVPHFPVSVVTITTTPDADESQWVLSGMPNWSTDSQTKGKTLRIGGLVDPYMLKREVMRRKKEQQHQGDSERSDPESLAGLAREESAGLLPMDKEMS